MKLFFALLIPLLLILGLYFLSGLSVKQISYIIQPSVAAAPTPVVSTPAPSPIPVNKLIYLDDVPFVAQAPFGNWKDPLEQNGCEEAAATIAVYWAENKPLSKQQMLDEIISISDYEDGKYGNAVDTSARDTVTRIIKGYFNYPNARAEKLTEVSQIITWLGQDYLVITPMDGQRVENPNYTAPGPERHMIVIRGYDPKNGEFITNDAGTRQGENFRYPKNRFFNAIRDYPTGDHLPFDNSSSKSAILIWK